ncbi:hypothetical protein AGMMS50239_29430 [Bacteroidia bacterium]|nr:hypothetical protein AGMMS50239_29430 [Bacteroidia bacterium]
MAIPIRHAPVLEGAAARRFDRLRKQAEKERGTLAFSEEQKESFKRMYAQWNKMMAERYEL